MLAREVPLNQRPLAWLIIVLGMIFSRAAYLDNIVYNIDETEYAVAADAWDHGWLPGVDLVGTTKPPGIVLLYDITFDLFGRSLTPIHVLHLVIMILAGLLVVELAIGLWGMMAACPSALLFWITANSYNRPDEILALNVESPAILFGLLALWLAWRYPSRIWSWLATGICIGIAALFRQVMLAFLLPLLVTFHLRHRLNLRLVLLTLAGVLLPWLPILVLYAARSGLYWAWYTWVVYPALYASDTGLNGFFAALYINFTEFLVGAVVPVLLAILGAIRIWKERSSIPGRFLIALFIASFLALSSGSRFFGHYWIQFFPVVALLAVPAWFHLRQRTRTIRVVVIVFLALGSVNAALHYPAWRTWDEYAPPPGLSPYALTAAELEKTTGAWAAERTSPGQTIAVWGYCPQIYWHANRLPGVRDYLGHWTTGYSPDAFDPLLDLPPRAHGHPLAERMFVEDLERRQPVFIFDLVPIQDYVFPFYRFSLRSYPEISKYVLEHYLPEGQVGEVRVYRRRTATDSWQARPEYVK